MEIFAENEVIYSGDDFYISYLARPTEFATALDNLCASMGARPPTGRPETALVQRDGSHFYILYGDHREAYAKLVPDFDACMAYFIANIGQIGHSSEWPEKH